MKRDQLHNEPTDRLGEKVVPAAKKVEEKKSPPSPGISVGADGRLIFSTSKATKDAADREDAAKEARKVPVVLKA